MKRILPIALSLAAVSSFVLAQDSPEVEKALRPAPANMKAAATVVKWKADFTYDTVKKGTNKMVCYDMSGLPGATQPVYIECTSLANLDRVAQNMKLNSIKDADQRKAAFEAAEKDGTRVKPEFGSVWLHVMGADLEHTRTHSTIAVPMATSKTLGLPENGQQGGVWIMNAGTTTAHLMTPGS